MLIHINGFPGVGKLTVAQELEKITGGKLIDNHAIINLAYLATEHGTPEYLALHAKLTDTLYATLAKHRAYDPLIFTNALAAELPEDVERHEKAISLSQQRADIFVPILLICDIEENKKRVVDATRAARQKLTKPDAVDDIYARYTPYHPPHAHGLTLDTTRLSPQETALLIKRHCDAIAPNPTVKPEPTAQ